MAKDSRYPSTTGLPTTGFVRLPAILALIPISKSSWWEGVRLGRFPAPVKLCRRVSAWRAEDIKSLIENPERWQQAAPTKPSTRPEGAIAKETT
jgi:prophage regulatory protein